MPEKFNTEQNVFKILTTEQWSDFQTIGEFSGAPVDLQDGYIHLSSQNQVAETARKHFANVSPLVILAINVEPIRNTLKWEVSRGDQLFPHYYDILKLEHVVEQWLVEKLENGEHRFPEGF